MGFFFSSSWKWYFDLMLCIPCLFIFLKAILYAQHLLWQITHAIQCASLLVCVCVFFVHISHGTCDVDSIRFWNHSIYSYTFSMHRIDHGYYACEWQALIYDFQRSSFLFTYRSLGICCWNSITMQSLVKNKAVNWQCEKNKILSVKINNFGWNFEPEQWTYTCRWRHIHQ